MSKNILILSPKVLKDRTAIHTNTDDKLLYTEIKAAQDMYLLPLLGSSLFNKIISDINTDTLSGYYKTLVDDFIIDMLCNYVLAELPDAINYQFTNKGVITKGDENSNAPSMTDLYSIIAKYKNRAEHYSSSARRYLLEYSDEHITEYTERGTGYDAIHPDTTSFSSPIYLGHYNDECEGSLRERYGGY